MREGPRQCVVDRHVKERSLLTKMLVHESQQAIIEGQGDGDDSRYPPVACPGTAGCRRAQTYRGEPEDNCDGVHASHAERGMARRTVNQFSG